MKISIDSWHYKLYRNFNQDFDLFQKDYPLVTEYIISIVSNIFLLITLLFTISFAIIVAVNFFGLAQVFIKDVSMILVGINSIAMIIIIINTSFNTQIKKLINLFSDKRIAIDQYDY